MCWGEAVVLRLSLLLVGREAMDLFSSCEMEGGGVSVLTVAQTCIESISVMAWRWGG